MTGSYSLDVMAWLGVMAQKAPIRLMLLIVISNKDGILKSMEVLKKHTKTPTTNFSITWYPWHNEDKTVKFQTM